MTNANQKTVRMMESAMTIGSLVSLPATSVPIFSVGDKSAYL